jgi:3-oxoacyl-[acyl-carrier-protein] synthase-3
MIGIKSIAAEIPTRRVEAARMATAAGIDELALRNSLGFTHLSRRALAQEASDLCLSAAEKLFETEQILPAEIDCVVVVTQNPDGYGIPHTAAIVQAKLGLAEGCASFDLSLGGSGYIYGLSIVKSFMESNGLKRGLLFTSDPYSRVVAEFDGQAAMYFGDAATVTILTDEPTWRIGLFDFGTVGTQGHTMQVRVKLGGRLYLDRRAIFQFALERGPQSLRNVVKRNGLTVDQIDRIFVQQGSREIVQGIAREIGVSAKVGFHAESYGDTISSSIPIALAQNTDPNDRRVALWGFGAGLSWASTVLTRVL